MRFEPRWVYSNDGNTRYGAGTSTVERLVERIETRDSTGAVSLTERWVPAGRLSPVPMLQTETF